MQEQSYFQLISPLIFVILAIGFYLIYCYEKHIKSAKLFAISYVFGAVGFVLDYFRVSWSEFGFDMMSNVFYMLAAVFFSGALLTHRRGEGHWRTLFAFFTVAMFFTSWFAFVDPNIVSRIYAMNIMATILFGYPVLVLWRSSSRFIDRLILALVGITAIHFTIRVFTVLWFEASTLTDANYAHSMAAITLQFTSSIAALFTAMALFVMFGMEIVLQLRSKSETDELTGLLNRRGLDSALGLFEAALEKGVQSHGVLMIDLDHFKNVNDSYGHDAGDQVLETLADVLSKLDKGHTTIARLGGEEFCIVVYNANEKSTRLVAEYVRSVFEMQPHKVISDQTVTTSIGMSTWCSGERFSDSLRRADKALYDAKRKGRNRVCIAPSIFGEVDQAPEALKVI